MLLFMKKILYVYHASNIGGGTYCLLNILKEVNRCEIEPVVLLKSYGPLVDEINKMGIEVKYFSEMSQVPYNKSLYRRNVLSRYIKLEKSKSQFKEIVLKIKVDAVYLNTIVLAPYLETCKELGLKTIIHIREHWPLDEHKFQLQRLQKCIIKYADEIVAINSYSASIVPNRNSTIVYDWIDFKDRYEYKPFREIFKEDVSQLKVYLYTGGDQAIKGFYEVINAFSNHVKDMDARLLVLGVGNLVIPKGVKGKIKRVLYWLGFDAKRKKAYELIKKDSRIVTMPGTYKIEHIFRQAYCNLSYFTIPHANLALAESIILGTVTIAAKNEESLEYSDNGNLSILFKEGDYQSFLSAINNLDSHYHILKKRLKESDIIKKQFDRGLNSQKLSEVYSRILSI